jgi:uncharacterized membrane protein YbhN (UPF0104 family)
LTDQPAVSREPSLAVKIDSQKGHRLAWQAVAKRAVAVVLAGVAIYLVFPAITEVFASWPRLSTLDPRWFILAIGAEVAHFGCTIALQRLALPVLALPVILAGAPTSRSLVTAAVLGAAGFVVFAAFGAVILAYDWPLRSAGRAVQRLRNWALRKRPPLHGLDETLLTQRNEIRAVLGEQWWQALLLSAGRLAFDYLCLLAALRATGARPRPSLILVAYAVAGIIGLIPITPGGLGVVEASLTGLLVLAQVDSSQAVLATLTYRLASYWAPLCAGPIAYGAFWMRYRRRRPQSEGSAA